ncbi:beta-mannosidase [Rathayibacter caricis DSM 15933]|uniref:beta-mannosidase n=1 Tax=Rathayibacter caricis DSM 15933 TaxID=1328867 RepID=A0A2T4UU05_9MICO|nr:glycoside hydrolase family 2 protein [Rathayibacter caricis]PTL72983.1 beta-mannosidase [Rathayibacter caricis DSM 15933]
MTVIPLHENWTLRALEGPEAPERPTGEVAATVPGCVHTDLLAAGLIPDPFDGGNESRLSWIGRTAWVYETRFAWSDDGSERYDLVAEGLDTVATLRLNGDEIGRTENQHRSYRFDVRESLVEGENLLSIEFAAPVDEAERRSIEHGPRPHVNHHPYNALRKTASNFGWDWGIDVATSGIWRPIGLESWSGVRIAAVRPLVDVDGTDGVLSAHVDLEWAGASSAEVSVAAGGAETATTVDAGTAEAVLALRVPDVDVWWPRGYGEQPLYDVGVAAGDESVWTGRVGFRTVRVDTTPDEDGSPYRVEVNGRTVQIRGANWIPDHAFVTEVDRDRYARRIADATEANMNLLRVWGGGIYESHDFYDLCDEQGVLVWQDFLFACAAYAEEEWLAVEVEPEAREAVTRLSAHPSLIIWNGNNENIVGYTDWGWRTRLAGATWGNAYYRRLLPGILAELDPTRFYSPGSPYSFDDYLHPNDPANGTVHIWDVWNTRDYTGYADWRPRFVSEFGFQGPPAWSTLTSVVHDEPLEPYGEQMLVHQKAHEGNLKLERGLAGHLPTPVSIEDWHWATQLNQAAALRFGIEHFRSLSPLNTGVVVWQLNDDWPVVSWAAVDFHEHRKPLWFALRAAYAPRLATIQPRDGGPAAVLLNDTDEAWSGSVVARRLQLDGTVLAEERWDAAVPARGEATTPLPAAITAFGDVAGEIVSVQPEGWTRALLHPAEVVDQALDPSPLEASAERSGADVVVTVTARSLARDVTLLVDRVDAGARVDEGLVTLLAGESARFTISGAAADADPDAFLDPLVVRHAGGLHAAVPA